MLPVLGDIKDAVEKFKFFKSGRVSIDSVFAKLHYQFTFGILLASCILVSSGQFFGKPIQCMQDAFSVRQEALDQYCYVAATFSMPRLFTQHKLGKEVAHLGVGPMNGEEPTYHNYYQWVPFVLLSQALMFYLPHYMWKNMEGGMVKKLVDGVTNFSIAGIANDVNEKIEVLASYFHNTRQEHTLWGLKCVLCEVLYFVNVVGQIFLTDRFLGGAFLDFGTRVLSLVNQDPEVRVDPMALIFPRMTKCTFQRYGPSGTIQLHDSLCLLAINIVNEKIYIFLWFWFVFLAAITGTHLIYRFASFFFDSVRRHSLIWLAGAKARSHITLILRNYSFSDWLLLDAVMQNISDQKVYIALLKKISDLENYQGVGMGKYSSAVKDGSELSSLNSSN